MRLLGKERISSLIVDGFDALTWSTVPPGRLAVTQYHITKVHISEALCVSIQI
jgi:hypothetical protein